MNKIRITKQFNFETGHALYGYDGACRNVHGHKVMLADYQPTCELLVIDFANKIKKCLPENISLHSLKLQETESSFANWYESDQ